MKILHAFTKNGQTDTRIYCAYGTSAATATTVLYGNFYIV